MTKPSLLVIIPARGGSKRLLRKNMRLLGGVPLIVHTFRFLESEGLLQQGIVSTDDADIAACASAFGLRVPFIRPLELSSDEATTLAVVLHALEHHRADKCAEPEYVGVLQPTSPFRRPGLLMNAIEELETNRFTSSVIAMSKLHVSANFVFRSAAEGIAPLCHDAVNAMVPTGSVYVSRTDALRSQASLFATPVIPLMVSGPECIDIDTEDDFRIAEALVANAPATTGISDLGQSAGSAKRCCGLRKD